MDPARTVGPVLLAGRVADAVVAAIREECPGAVVHDQGSYVRVLVPGRCALTRAAVERELGRAFELPRDLEPVMPSFKGHLRVTSEGAEWGGEQGDP